MFIFTFTKFQKDKKKKSFKGYPIAKPLKKKMGKTLKIVVVYIGHLS